MTLAVEPVYAGHGLVAIGTSATGDAMTNATTFFRSTYSTSEAGESIASYLFYALGNFRAIVLLKDDGYGQSAAAGFKRDAERLGITAKHESFTKTAEAEDLAHWAAGDPTHPAIVLAMIDEAEAGGCRGQHLLT